MTIDWEYPVAKMAEVPTEGTFSAPVRRALELNEAFELLSEGDTRPLLVLREFSTFDDPGNAKLTRKLYTEATVTMSHWFRCVRLPHHVEEADHPFHNLYASERPPQLFFATPDGRQVWPFEYESSRADLDALMVEVLAQFYDADVAENCAELVRMLPKLDQVDAEIQRLKEELDKAVEDDGPKGARFQKVQKKLTRAEAEKEALLARKTELEDIARKG